MGLSRRFMSGKLTLDKTIEKANKAVEEVHQGDAFKEEVKNAIAMLEEGAVDSEQART